MIGDTKTRRTGATLRTRWRTFEIDTRFLCAAFAITFALVSASAQRAAKESGQAGACGCTANYFAFCVAATWTRATLFLYKHWSKIRILSCHTSNAYSSVQHWLKRRPHEKLQNRSNRLIKTTTAKTSWETNDFVWNIIQTLYSSTFISVLQRLKCSWFLCASIKFRDAN